MRSKYWVRLAAVGVASTIATTMPRAAEAGGDDLFPPNAKAGECYARVFIPPTYRTETERVLVKEASESVETLPARYEWTEERVLVKEASTRIVEIPAVYEWAEDRVLVQGPSSRLEEVPAVYETETEQVLESPAHTVWKKGKGLLQKVDHATGEVMCLVEVPATYKTVTKRALKTPATTRTVDVPEEYKVIRRQVLKAPATTRTVEIPAEYKTVRVMKQSAPPEVKRTPIPAEYRTVTKNELVTDGRMEWKPVLCETNADTQTVSAIQNALRSAGYDPGPSDGVMGARTLEAMTSFQKAKGLASGSLTTETLSALGVRTRA